jgi:hypothetical protein
MPRTFPGTAQSHNDSEKMIFKILALGEWLSLAFLASVAKAALVTGTVYVLFPELAALGYDVFTRPAGVWARSPVMLAVTPLRALRLHMPPALSMGLLPQIVPQADWHFALALAIGTLALSSAFLLARPSLLTPRGALEAG